MNQGKNYHMKSKAKIENKQKGFRNSLKPLF